MAADLSKVFSSMPDALPDLATRKPVNYTQRMISYYSHLSRLAADELEEDVKSNTGLYYTFFMTAPFSAIILHALDVFANVKNIQVLDMHNQSAIVRKALQRSFNMNYLGRDYLVALCALEDCFAEADELDNASKMKLASFSDNFAEQLDLFIKSSNNVLDGQKNEAYNRRLPFVRIGWKGEYDDGKITEMGVDSRIIQHPREITVPRDPEVIRAPSIVAAG